MRMVTFLRTTLLATCFLGWVGCASAPPPKTFKPLEDGDAVMSSSSKPGPVVAETPQGKDDPVAPTPISTAECVDKTDCQFKGPPGKGLRWACTEGQCVTEAKRRHHHH